MRQDGKVEYVKQLASVLLGIHQKDLCRRLVLQQIRDGGQKFLTQLWERNTVQDPSEAIDICEAYLKGRGVLI